MRYLFGFVCACAFGVVPLVGCGDDSSGGAGTGGAGTGGAGGGAEPVQLTLTVIEGATGADRPPLEGVAFCETDTANCAMTDANGQATIEIDVPADGQISYTYAKDGYASVLRTEVVDDTFVGERTNFTLPDETMVDLSEAVMTPYPYNGTGSATVDVGLSGATLEVVGASSEAFYYDETLWPDPALEATTSSGWGAFVEVAPGEVEIRLGGTATNCVAAFGWPGSEANTVRMPIRVGFVSWSSASCEPQ